MYRTTRVRLIVLSVGTRMQRTYVCHVLTTVQPATASRRPTVLPVLLISTCTTHRAVSIAPLGLIRIQAPMTISV